MKIISFLFLLFTFLTSFSQNPKSYTLFDSNGNAITWDDVVKKAQESDMVFFGEYHNDPIGHWLQLELTQSLFKVLGNKLVCGAEMFESDNQLIINEYNSGLIPAKKFEDEARLWPNYSTDYKPLLDFAVSNKIPFIATNIPRRYASMVASSGLEALEKLSTEAKSYIAPLPILYDGNLNCYQSMMGMGGMGKNHNENLPKAQAIKDATMSYFIMKNRKA